MMKIDVNKIGKWDEIIKKHWEYVEHNVIPKIDEIEDKDIKEFLNDNLEIIIKGTKNEWDKEIILQYKRLINNTLESHIQAIIQDFMHSRKQKITTILKELEDKGYNSYAEYEDFEIKLREWNKKCQEKEVGKLSFKQDCKGEFLKENFNQEYRTFQMYQKINKAFDYDKFTKGDEVIDWGRHKFLMIPIIIHQLFNVFVGLINGNIIEVVGYSAVCYSIVAMSLIIINPRQSLYSNEKKDV